MTALRGLTSLLTCGSTDTPTPIQNISIADRFVGCQDGLPYFLNLSSCAIAVERFNLGILELLPPANQYRGCLELHLNSTSHVTLPSGSWPVTAYYPAFESITSCNTAIKVLNTWLAIHFLPGPTPAPPGPAPLGSCSLRKKYPDGHNYLEQDSRPPEQTVIQAAVLDRNIESAVAQSAAAESWVQRYLDSVVRPDLSGLNCSTAPAEELMEMLKWEISHLQLIHNAPVFPGEAGIDDDTDLRTSLENGFLESVLHRYLLGEESKANALGESNIMTKYLGFPPL